MFRKFFNKLKTYEADHEDAGVFAIVDWIDLSMTLGRVPCWRRIWTGVKTMRLIS